MSMNGGGEATLPPQQLQNPRSNFLPSASQSPSDPHVQDGDSNNVDEELSPFSHQKVPFLLIVLLCTYSFLAFFKPASPFLVDLLTEEKNFTRTEVFEDIFPVWTYSQLGFMVVYGATAEYFSTLGHRCVIFFGALCFLCEPFFMIFTDSLPAMQTTEVFVAAGISSIQIFSAYSFTIVKDSYFQKVTSYTRTFFLLGTVTSSLLGQLLLLFDVCSYNGLYYITMGTSTICVIITLLLPRTWSTPIKVQDEYVSFSPRRTGGLVVRDSADGSVYVQRSYRNCGYGCGSSSPDCSSSARGEFSETESLENLVSSQESDLENSPSNNTRGSCTERLNAEKFSLQSSAEWDGEVHDLGETHAADGEPGVKEYGGSVLPCFTFSFSSLQAQWEQTKRKYKPILRLSIWFVFALPVHSLVMTYLQVLLSTVNPSANFNGFLFATSYVLAALATLFPTKLEKYFASDGIEVVLIVLSAASAFLLFTMALTSSIIVLYIAYITYHCTFEFMLTVIYAAIAKRLPINPKKRRSFAMTFSLNVFFALSLQCIIQFIVGKQVLDLSAPAEYIFFGFVILVLSFSMMASLLLLTYLRGSVALPAQQDACRAVQ